MADKLVELEVTSVSGVYAYPPEPAEGEDAEEGVWTATVYVQGNPFTGLGASLDEAIDAAVEAYETRGQVEEPEATPVKAQAKEKAAEK